MEINFYTSDIVSFILTELNVNILFLCSILVNLGEVLLPSGVMRK